MKRALYALGALALGIFIVMGCNSGAAAGVRVTDAEVKDWTNPDDGKTYLVVAPTWTNEGKEAVREVRILATLKGAAGEYPNESTPETVNNSLHYRGDPVDPGSTMRPSDSPDSFIVMGEKEVVLAATGPDPKAEAMVFLASTELSEEG